MSTTSHGMHVMEHDGPLKIFHGHAMIMEKLPCPMDRGKGATFCLQHGKPTVAWITRLFQVSRSEFCIKCPIYPI